MHTGSHLSAPVWFRFPYQRGTDKKNGAVWLRSIWLPCEPTDRIQEKVQIGNEANFVSKRRLSTFLYSSSWLRGMSTSNMYLSLIGSTWICSCVHVNSRMHVNSLQSRMHTAKILDQIQKRTEPYGSALELFVIEKIFSLSKRYFRRVKPQSQGQFSMEILCDKFSCS